MLGFMQNLRNRKQYKQLEEIIQRIEMNVSNNYKDAAQENLKELEKLLQEMETARTGSEKQISYYRSRLSEFQGKMKNFTHKDQKPTWV